MTIINIKNAGFLAAAILSIGVLNGCEYCQPMLLATICIMTINAVSRCLKTVPWNDLVELFSHMAH
jgi:hypothetical protein